VRIYVFRDGKIAKVQNIFDTAAYAAALRPA
jgi:ketosteroid isomerase-like protein